MENDPASQFVHDVDASDSPPEKYGELSLRVDYLKKNLEKHYLTGEQVSDLFWKNFLRVFGVIGAVVGVIGGIGGIIAFFK